MMTPPDSLALLRLPGAMSILAIAALAHAAWGAPQETGAESVAAVPPLATPMSEKLRSEVTKIVILPIAGNTEESVTGTYRKQTPGMMGGIEKGSGMGSIPVEVGHVPINIPIPILREIGMIAGGITGKVQRDIQEFRDRLTDDLSDAVEQPLTNAALATDVYWGLRNVSSVDPKLFAVTTPIPEGTDAILYINLDELTLNVQGKEAIITTAATARLERLSDRATLYRKQVKYEDRDKLDSWIDDDYLLWQQYRIFARHYIARELSAELYERVVVKRKLTPTGSDTVRLIKKNNWHGKSESLTPTLVWAFELSDDTASLVEGADILWDIEIYDSHRPVYSAKQVAGTEHTVTAPLQACGMLRWTVRPTYYKEGVRKNGRWMRANSEAGTGNGNVGRDVSEAHAYIQDFAALEIKCRR